MTDSWELLAKTITNVAELDGPLMEEVGERLHHLAKPTNGLGRLERLCIRLAGITKQMRPALAPRTLIVCASDHGVTIEGVSTFPHAVTAQMVHNTLAGGSAASVLARLFHVNLIVLDVGVAEDLSEHRHLRRRKIRPGTANFAQEPAMNRKEAVAAIEMGIQVANAEISAGTRLLCVGDLGVGSTTASSAIAALLSRLPPSQVTGMGSGIGLSAWRRKCEVIESALEFHLPDPNDSIDVLGKVGGLEIGAIAGIIIAGAAARVPVVLDGLTSCAGAAIAAGLCPGSKSFMIAGHRSVEPGHQILLDYLDLSPVLNLDIAMGEGTGALMSLSVLDAAMATLNEMATYEEAGLGRVMTAQHEFFFESEGLLVG